MESKSSLDAAGELSGVIEQNVPAYEQRLAAVERKVYGHNQPRSAKQKFSCAERLVSIDSRMKTATKANRDNIRAAWSQLEDLDHWMKSVQSQNLPESAKSDVILAQEASILETASNLSSVIELKNVISSEPLANVGELSAKVKPLLPVHLQQLEQCTDLQGGVRQLLEAYNVMLGLLSDQFVALNEVVSELESRKQEKQSS
ncbi:uncharacterized protein LOC135821421 [Sycon ciliatum]|uniref:uncharacterized protein LOC135821421 n=1 Tax=Sycon ciliatum TaxID=27933 RepID=UPI0031F6F68C